MAEIKTCEQYVLAKMAELEYQNENLRNNVEELISVIKVYEEGINALKKYLTVESISQFKEDRKHYITMEDIHEYKADERDDVRIIMTAFNLHEEEEEDASISDQIQTENME